MGNVLHKFVHMEHHAYTDKENHSFTPEMRLRLKKLRWVKLGPRLIKISGEPGFRLVAPGSGVACWRLSKRPTGGDWTRLAQFRRGPGFRVGLPGWLRFPKGTTRNRAQPIGFWGADPGSGYAVATASSPAHCMWPVSGPKKSRLGSVMASRRSVSARVSMTVPT